MTRHNLQNTLLRFTELPKWKQHPHENHQPKQYGKAQRKKALQGSTDRILEATVARTKETTGVCVVPSVYIYNMVCVPSSYLQDDLRTLETRWGAICCHGDC